MSEALDLHAATYEEALARHNADPGAPGRYEAMEEAWDAMVETVHAEGHDVDTCTCRSCALYRAGTEE